MEINLLVVSVGNSRIAMGTFVAGKLENVQRMPANESADWTGRVGELWKKISGRDNAAIVGASVNPPVAEAFGSVVEKTAAQRIVWIGRDVELPISLKTEQPKETGVDRVLNIAAAYEQMQKACIVVDAGTAITIDCCNDDGEFLGGAIAAGAKMQLAALHERTAKLPTVELAIPEGPFGTSTSQAMLQGVYHGIRGMVKELAENYATELGSWPEIIATGGDAKLLFEGWELIHAIVPDLTLYGIALAYVENDLKNRDEEKPAEEQADE